MPHYSNGLPATIGDFAEGKDTTGEVSRGVIFQIYEGTDTCNARVAIIETKRRFKANGAEIQWTVEPVITERTLTLKECKKLA